MGRAGGMPEMNWTATKNKLPMSHEWCLVQATCRGFDEELPFKFIREQRGSGYWDDFVDMILQESEVTHWKIAED